MLIKSGVDISRLNREIRRALTKIEKILTSYGQEIIITSTFEGNHSAGSLHYSNDAFDIRLLYDNLDPWAKRIKKDLGKDYDVVVEKGHIHIEYDPK